MKHRKNLLILINSLFLLFSFTNIKVHQERDPFRFAKVTPFSSVDIANEPRFSSQFHFDYINYGNIYSRYSGEGITIAIIDSGINTNHVDYWDGLQTNISSKSAYIEEQGNNYYSNVVIQTVANYGLNIIEDSDNHGTNVAGTIGALVNDVGGAGVAPQVSLMVLKVNYIFTEVDKAIRYATDNGAHIINMSFGAYEETFIDGLGNKQDGISGASTYFQSAINYAHNKGVTLIAAAGNENTNVSSYPAANNHVIGVGALAKKSNSLVAYYSNYGANNVDIYAPGTVYVTHTSSPTSYVETLGTSFAAPIIASAAALYKEANPYATPNDITNALIDSATTFSSSIDAGRLDLKNLLSDIKVEGVEISPKSHTLRVGETVQLSAAVLPLDATNQEIIFISEDESVASVDEDTGLVTGVSVGLTEIYVLTDDGMFEDNATITVVEPILYEKTLVINDNNFQKNYVFGEELDLEHLSATYTDEYNTSHNISGASLTLVSGNTKTLGQVTLVFSYQGLSESVMINVTNVGAPTNGSPQVVSHIVHGLSFSPILTTTATNYTSIVSGGITFSGNNLKINTYNNLNNFMINSEGHFTNTTPLNNLSSIKFDYLPSGSEVAVQIVRFSSLPFAKGEGPITTTLNTSNIGQSATVNAPSGSKYFRVDIGKKYNLQANITLTYADGVSLSFTPLEQATAYYDYFMDVTHEECLVSNVQASTWLMLENEYNAMSLEAQTKLKELAIDELNPRYSLIINKYHYDDFIYLTTSNEQALLSNKNTTSKILIIFVISSTLVICSFFFLENKKKTFN